MYSLHCGQTDCIEGDSLYLFNSVSPFSDFSSVFTEVWLPGTTEMTRRLFEPLVFGVMSASSLLLAESLSADSEDEDGLLDSLGVFLSSAEKQE